MFKTNTSFFGLDIGTTGVRLVQLRKSDTGLPGLVTYGALPVSKPYINSDATGDHDKLAEVIRQLVAETKTTTNNVVAAIPATHAFITVITVPMIKESELAKALQLQAEQYIPLPVNQVKLDWHIIGPKGDNEMEVLLVAAPTKVIDKYAVIIEKAGLELEALEISALAVSRSLVADPEVPVMIVNFGHASTDVTMTFRGVPYLSRSVNVGRNTLLKSIIQNLNLEEEQADQFLQKFGLTKNKLEGQVLKAMKAPLDSLVEELNKSLKFFSSKNSLKLEKIIITGGASMLPELPVHIANTLQLPVEIGNPWNHVSYPFNVQEQLMNIAPQFATAVGLAQRSML